MSVITDVHPVDAPDRKILFTGRADLIVESHDLPGGTWPPDQAWRAGGVLWFSVPAWDARVALAFSHESFAQARADAALRPADVRVGQRFTAEVTVAWMGHLILAMALESLTPLAPRPERIGGGRSPLRALPREVGR